MKIAENKFAKPALRAMTAVLCGAVLGGWTVVPAVAQSVAMESSSVVAPVLGAGETASLPEAPSPVAASADMQVGREARPAAGPVAPKYWSVIPAGVAAQPITGRDKVIIGLRDSISFTNFASAALSAGYSHVSNGQPNYGRNATAFGQRFGAAAVKETSESLFSESILAPVLHQDPRYFVRGNQHNVLDRTFYAITRPLLTKTDGGRTTVNASLLLGYAGSTALDNAFYPQINRNFKDNASSFGGSIGGAALGFFVAEFEDDVLQALHLEKKTLA